MSCVQDVLLQHCTGRYTVIASSMDALVKAYGILFEAHMGLQASEKHLEASLLINDGR